MTPVHREFNNHEGGAAEHHGIEGGDLEQHRVDEPGGGEGQDEARGQTRGDRPQPLCAHVADDAAPHGAQGQPDGELATAADNSLRHRAEDAGADEHEPAAGEAGRHLRQETPNRHARREDVVEHPHVAGGKQRVEAPHGLAHRGEGRGGVGCAARDHGGVRRRELPIREAGDETGGRRRARGSACRRRPRPPPATSGPGWSPRRKAPAERILAGPQARRRLRGDHGDRAAAILSGTTGRGLDSRLRAVRKGDVLVVWKLDRLGRNLVRLVNTVQDLSARGVGLLAGDEGADPTPRPRAAASCSASSRRWPSSRGS